MRVVVIGGGVIGLACAHALARGGVSVVLLDAAPEAREASWAAAGMLAPHHEASATDDLWRLGVDSLGRWPAFARDLGGDLLLDHRQIGGLVPILTDADAREGETRMQALSAVGVAAQWWDRAQVRQHEPELTPEQRGAWCIPGGQVDPRRLLERLQLACASAGVELRYGSGVAAVRLPAVELLDGSRVSADWVVIASGAWTPALAQATGIDLAGEPVKGQMLRLQAADGLLRHYLHSHHAYVVPRAGAGLVVGSTMVEVGFDRSADPLAITHLVAQARSLLPGLADAPVLEHWTGLRPRLRGGRPVIGQMRPGVVLATGHFRNGILLTPATAAAVAAIILGHPLSPQVVPFTSIPSFTTAR